MATAFPPPAAAGSKFDNATDDSIARRRAELRRLQGLTSTTANSRTADSKPAASASRQAPPARRGPPPARNSDLFPQVPKSGTVRSRSATRSRTSASVRGRTGASGGPPPPPTARRLEQSFGGSGIQPTPSASSSSASHVAGTTGSAAPPVPSKRVRAKSAPPARPPPPPRPADKSPNANPHPTNDSSGKRPAVPGSENRSSIGITPKLAVDDGVVSDRQRARPQPISASSLLGPNKSNIPHLHTRSKQPPVHSSTAQPSSPPTTKSVADVSTPDVRKTPSVAPGGSMPPPSTARKDLIRAMRSGATTPPTLKKTVQPNADLGADDATNNNDGDDNTPNPVPELVSSPKQGQKSFAVVGSQAVTTTTMTTTATTSAADTSVDRPNGNHEKRISDMPTDPVQAMSSSSSTQSEALLRIEATWRRVEQEKKEALRKNIQLEAMLAKVQAQAEQANEPKGPASPMEFKALLDLADTQGEKAAVEWAREQLRNIVANGATPTASSFNNRVGFASPDAGPATPRGGIFTPEQQNTRPRRMATPYPRHRLLDEDEDNGVGPSHINGSSNNDRNMNTSKLDESVSSAQALTNRQATERKFQSHFVQAAKCIPYEYSTNVATFIIRRPYGIETEPDLFQAASLTDAASYGRRAHVSTPSSMEVVAKINADGSLLCLSNEAAVRYFIQSDPAIGDDAIPSVPHTGSGDGVLSDSQSWKVVANVDELGKPLGNITYIDEDANERDYSLDEVFDGAVMCREHYCTSLFSAAMGLKETHRQVEEQVQQQIEAAKDELEYHHQKELEFLMDEHKRDLKRKQKETEKMIDERLRIAAQDGSLSQNKAADKQKAGKEVCVGTEDLSFPSETVAPNKGGEKDMPNKEKKKAAAPPPPDDSGSDVTAVFVGMLFSLFFGMLYTVFIKIPLRIISTTLYLSIGILLLSIAWVYLADDHGHYLMGTSAVTSGLYNQPGIY